MADTLTPTERASQPAGPVPTEASGSTPGGGSAATALLIRHRRWLLFAAGALMLAGFIGLILWSSESPYRPVYAGLSEKDAARIVELLQKEHVPYRLEGGGTVLVPADQVYQVRLKLAGEGVAPSQGDGFELFDRSNEFGLSEFTRKINLQRALQGELARTIEVIPEVTAARVHLVLPRESAFAERDRKASASVMLQIAGGQRLPKASVQAIQNLVAASVPELEPEQVTIVDAAGRLLSGNDRDQPLDEGQSLAEYQARLEQRLEDRLTGMLEQIVGPGQAVVRVSAEINREYVEQHTTRYNPDEQVLRSQKSIEEQRQSVDAPAEGVPGLASNTPGANPAASGTQPRDTASRVEQVNNYEISSTNEHRIVPFGSVDRLSVAVVVGGHRNKGEDGTETFTPRSPEELAAIRQIVERAIGYDEERGDAVDVKSMPLVDISSPADAEALAAAENRAFYLRLARYLVALVALLLLALFVLRPLARRLKQEPEVSAGRDGEPLLAIPEMSSEAYARLMKLDQLRQQVARDPERASRVLREWMDPA